MTRRPLIRSLFLTMTVTLLVVRTSPAMADRPWQNAEHPATIVADAPAPALLPGSLISMAGHGAFALTPEGDVLHDGGSGVFAPLPTQIPPLTLLSKDGDTLWGLTGNRELVKFDETGHILAHVSIEQIATPASQFTALQIKPPFAFLADGGDPALAVVNLATAKGQRALGHDISVTGQHPFIRGGKTLIGQDGRPETGGNVRMLRFDGRKHWLFYQAPAGPLYRIDPALLTDPGFSPVEQLDGIVEWRSTPSLGALVLSPDDHFFMLDVADGALLSFGPDRIPLRILKDSRLIDATAAALLSPKLLIVAVQEQNETHILHIALP